MSEQSILMLVGVIIGSLASYAGQFLAVLAFEKYQEARERKAKQTGKG